VGLILAAAAVVALAVGPSAWAAKPGSKAARPFDEATVSGIQELMKTPPFDRGVWGLKVVDMKTGRVLYGQNRKQMFHTASTTKTFTTATALDDIGPNHRFRTRVVRRGGVSADGTLGGELVLRASGDLTMGGRALPDGTVDYTGFDHTDANEVPGAAVLTIEDALAGLDRLARQTRRAGVERISGDVVIDDRLWTPTKVNREVVSSIVVNDNAIDISMTPTSPGELVKATTRPATEAYDIDVRVRTVAAGGTTEVEVHEATPDRRVLVTGTIATDAATAEHPFIQIFRVPDPAFFARTLFIEALRRAGVAVDAATVAPNDATALPARRKVARLPRVARLVSPPLSEFTKLINKVSHNLGANTVPFWLGLGERGRPTLEKGVAEIARFAKRAGAKPSQFTFVDGQGGPDDQFSPNAAVKLLRYVRERNYGKSFFKSLPVKNVDGLPPPNAGDDPSSGHVFEKNGVNGAVDANDLIEVQAMALAGYVRAGRRELAFDLVVNHVPILDPDGNPSQTPEDLARAFKAFPTLEGITQLMYESQR
jgi:D-alanyl-D-alanine carboxypeptidase/D-alanyl-D-alanine-endopeptidase (penicillin-binding protein 4)